MNLKIWFDIAEKYDLTLDQVMLLFISKEQDNDAAVRFINYLKECYDYEYDEFMPKLIETLEDTGLLINIKPTSRENTILADLQITPLFEQFQISKYTAAEELVEAYPKRVRVDNTIHAAINMPIDEIEKMYYRYHRGDPGKHKEVLDITRRFNKSCQGTAHLSIKKYLWGQYWLILKDELSGDNDDLINVSL